MLKEQQQLLFDLCQPFWQRKSKAKGRAKALCQQDMLVWLGRQSGIDYKQFEDYTNEDIEKVIPFIEKLK